MTEVKYRSTAGTVFSAELLERNTETALIQIEGDPFPVEVPVNKLENNMATKEKAKTAKVLRQEAKGLGIEGYEEMSRAELKSAVENAQAVSNDTAPRRKKRASSKSKTTKKTPAKKATKKTTTKSSNKKSSTPKKATTKKKTGSKKAAAKEKTKRTRQKREIQTGGRVKKLPLEHRAGRMSEEEKEAIAKTDNPYRPGTNIWYITEALLKGGKRTTLVKSLRTKVEFNPRVQSEKEFDRDAEIDRRLRIFAYDLKNRLGYTYVLKGRGKEAFIKVYPPNTKVPKEEKEYAQKGRAA